MYKYVYYLKINKKHQKKKKNNNNNNIKNIDFLKYKKNRIN